MVITTIPEKMYEDESYRMITCKECDQEYNYMNYPYHEGGFGIWGKCPVCQEEVIINEY